MPVTIAIAAADAVLQAELAVKAEYLEGGGHSVLPILVRSEEGSTQHLQVPIISPPSRNALMVVPNY